MLTVAGENSILERAVREIEGLMNTRDISIEMTPNGLAIAWRGKLYPIVRTDYADRSISFPRSLDTERLKIDTERLKIEEAP